MCIYIYMYVWVEVTRPTLYIDDIYICMYVSICSTYVSSFFHANTWFS